METGNVLQAQAWVEQIFGTVQLGDARRTRRLRIIVSALAAFPNLSLPKQMQGIWAKVKGAYRFLQNEAVSYEALARPTWEHTRQQMASSNGTVLLVQDTTALDFGPFPSAQGFGPLDDEYRQGLLVQTVLAVRPQNKQVLGVASQEPFVRQPLVQTPQEKKARRHQRRQNGESEAMVWVRRVLDIGRPSPGQRLIHVGDRAADFFRFLSTCRQTGTVAVVRAKQDRLVQGEQERLMELARNLPPQACGEVEVPSEHARRARQARVLLGWKEVTLEQPEDERRRDQPEEPLTISILRVWEPEPPLRVGGERPALPRRAQRPAKKKAASQPKQERMEGLEWVLLSMVPIRTEQDAWECIGWYRCRWLCEEFHHGMKTGCGLERRRLRTREGEERLLALLSPVAVRLLQLRSLIQQVPETVVSGLVPEDEVVLVAKLAQVPPPELTVETFLRTVARRGGFLGRKSDGHPGWKSIWEGWFQIHLMLQGIQWAKQQPP
jgi:hypothetical protein